MIPLLFECELEKSFSAVWCVGASRATQLRRLQARGLTPEESAARIDSQLPVAEKMARSQSPSGARGRPPCCSRNFITFFMRNRRSQNNRGFRRGGPKKPRSLKACLPTNRMCHRRGHPCRWPRPSRPAPSVSRETPPAAVPLGGGEEPVETAVASPSPGRAPTGAASYRPASRNRDSPGQAHARAEGLREKGIRDRERLLAQEARSRLRNSQAQRREERQRQRRRRPRSLQRGLRVPPLAALQLYYLPGRPLRFAFAGPPLRPAQGGRALRPRPRAEDKERYFALARVDKIEGKPAQEGVVRPQFDLLTPTFPNRRIFLEGKKGDVSMRAMDLICPLGFGQRGLIVAPPRTGKTILLQKIAQRDHGEQSRRLPHHDAHRRAAPRKSPTCSAQ